MNLLKPFRILKEALFSRPGIGGLEISHTALTYLAIRGSRSVIQASFKLPPGIVENGKIVNTSQFIEALKNLHSQITPANVPVQVVLVVPSALVYAQAFSVPIMNPKEQEEAIDLNLQMISPGKIEESYYDWQEIKQNEAAGHSDLLGAFAAKAHIDAYLGALSAANFNAVSVEFPGLSLSRLVKERWQSIETTEHYLLMYLSSEGLLVAILKNGNLYFNHFTPWSSIIQAAEARVITFADIEAFVTQEMQRVLTFYLGRTGHALKNAILISSLFNFEIAKIAEEKFALAIKNLAIGELPDLSSSWFPALGAGLRGLIPRSKDVFLSLSEASAKTEYYQERTLSLISLCRNIVIGALIFVFGAYVVVDGIFYRAEATNKTSTTFLNTVINTQEVVRLKEEVVVFNQAVQLAKTAKERESSWSPIFDAIRSRTGANITLDRIFADRSNLTLIVSGQATNELAAINYKSRLETAPNVKNVSLPLSQIKPEGENTVIFTLTLTLTKL